MKTGKMKSMMAAVALMMALNVPARAETELKFSSAAPPKTPWAAHFNSLAESIEQSSNGELKVVVFNGSQLGNEQDVIRQVVRGRVHMGGFSNTAASLIVPEIALLASPYLWDSLEQADCALDNHLISVYGDKFLKKGLVILGWTEVGYMGYASKNPIGSVSELAGMKLRVAPTKASSLTAQAYGANAVVLPITEVASGLQTGLVDGADLPTLIYASMGVGKVAPNWIASNHSHQVGMVLMSKKVWNRLSEEAKNQVMSIQVPPTKLRTQVRGASTTLLGKFSEGGGNVVNFNEQQMAEWESVGQKVQQQMVKEIGGDAADIYQKILDAKQACGA